ncbi:MAG: DUF167 domain-containing protein [Acidimicrobiia bacterium]
MAIVEDTGRGVEVALWVVPGASRDEITGTHGDAVRVRVTAPPEGGKANDAVTRLLEVATGGMVRIVSGHGSRTKRTVVTGATLTTVRRDLGLD